MASHVNIGIRHILPVYLACAILAAIAMVQLLRWAGTPAAALVVAVPLLWMGVAGARAHPNYLAYFNEFAGNKPENILLDSNFDWGQGWKLLARRLRELHVRKIHLYGPQTQAQYQTLQQWYGLPELTPLDAHHLGEPDPGWTAVNISAQKYWPEAMILATADNSRVMPWYYRVAPTERVAGFLLYRVTPGFIPGT